MINISKKLLLFFCLGLLASQISKAQGIELTYNCTGAGNALLSVLPTTNITSYSWKSSATGTTVLASTSTYIPTQSATYTVAIVKSGQPLTLTYAFTLPSNIVPNQPTILSSPTTGTICLGQRVMLKAVVANGNITKYSWQDESTLQEVSTESDVSVITSGKFSVKVGNTLGCYSVYSTPITVTINALPPKPTISSNGANTFCQGGNVVLNSNNKLNTNIWSRTSGSDTTTTGIDGISVRNSNTFTVKTVDGNGCTSLSSNPFTVTVNSLPAKPIINNPNTLNTPICGVATQSLTTSGGVSYTWKRGSTIISSGTSNVITIRGDDVLVGGIYDYTVSAQNIAGCNSDYSNPVSLKVSPKPRIPTITPVSYIPNIICGTNIKSLTALIDGIAVDGTGNTYTWKRNAVTVITSNATNSLDVRGTDAPTLTGGTYSYTVSYLNSVGCPSDESLAGVILQLFPTVPSKPTVSNIGSLTFCEGGTINLKSSYISNTNIWSRTAGGDTTTTAADEIIVRSSNIITVKGKDANGCTSVASDPITVKVNPRPIRPNLNRTGNIEICELDSIEVNATNRYTGGTYSWYKDNTPISSKSNVFLKADGNYTLEYTEGVNQCKSLVSLPTVLKVNLLPVKPTLSTFQSRPLQYCYKNENSGFNFATLLATSSTPNTKFLWDNGRIANTIDTTILIRSNKTEIIKVSATTISNKGCKSKDKSDEITITVFPLPVTPSITTNGPITFCPDSTVSLTSTDSPTGAYKWVNTKNIEFSDKKSVLIDTTSKNFTITPLGKIGRFYVRTISDKSCLSDTSRNVTVTVRNAPLKAVINPSPISATVCLGGKVTLKALFSNGNINRYSWRDESTRQEVSTEQEVSVISTGTYTVKIRDVFGCFADNSDPLKVTISPLPTKPSISILKPKIFCEEDSTIIQSSLPTTTPNGKNLYRWVVDGNTVLESNSRTFSWKRASGISVAVTDSNGCKAVAISDTIKTTVNPLPSSPSITARGPIPFCADKNVTLSAIGANGVTFKWSTGATTPNIITNSQGNVTVQAINGFGCLSKPSQGIEVRVNPLPDKPTLSVNNTQTVFCDGSKVRIVASSRTVFRDTYWWRSTTDSIGKGEDANSIFAAKTGNYFGKVQDDKGCISLASAPIAIDVRPNPTPTVVKKIGAFSLDAQGIGDENGYVWRYNGDVEKDLTTRIIKAKKDGNYQVQASITYTGVALAGGKLVCYSNTSQPIKYEQDPTFNGFSIFPNPTANGEINIEVLEDLFGATVMIYSMYGQLITEYKIDKFNTLKKIQLPEYHGNSYIIRVTTDGFEKTRRVINLKQ